MIKIDGKVTNKIGIHKTSQLYSQRHVLKKSFLLIKDF